MYINDLTFMNLVHLVQLVHIQQRLYSMADSHILSTLDAPWDVLDECTGVALDIGGSVIKITYIDKDDWVEPDKRMQGSSGKIRFSSFSKEKSDEAFNFIKSHAYLVKKSPNEKMDVFTTGVGSSQLAIDIRKQLNVRNYNLMEFDCFVHAFLHLLKNYTKKEVIYQPYKPAYEKEKIKLEKRQAMQKKFEGLTSMALGQDTPTEYTFQDDSSISWDKPMGAEDKDVFPCLLTMLGSAFATFMIKEDGSFSIVDGSNRGGRMFLGQGALMTGVKTYDELMALCEKGDFRGVNTTTVHLSEGILFDKQDVYNNIKEMDEATIYCFGQTVGKDRDDFKKEDIVCGLLQSLAHDITQTNHLLAYYCQVKHVFFCGSFLQHHLVREEIIAEWLNREVVLATARPFMKGKKIYCHFLKQGPHLGSLGAFLNSKHHFLKPAESSNQPQSKGKVQDNSQKATKGETLCTNQKDVPFTTWGK